jgi:hypothetical protein
MNNDKCSDQGSDIEMLAGSWEDEQTSLAAWHREKEEQTEADMFFDLQAMDEERKFRDRYQPWTGTSLNGRQLLIDVETGDICNENGQPLNSCDSLAVLDGCVDEEV